MVTGPSPPLPPAVIALPATAVPPTRFRPQSQLDLAPSGSVTRVRANLAALTTLRRIQREERPASAAEQADLARWSGWGAVPETFDDSRDDFAWARQELSTLLSDSEMAAAARNTLNAHYTDAALVEAIWGAAMGLGFEGGAVLEPGCGSGNFIGFAPSGAQMVGVELEPVTAAIAQALYPDAQVLAESFTETRAPEGSFDLVVGNVPFSRAVLHDRRHNAAGHAIHNHFILKALHLTRPGGMALLLTSRYTLDAQNPGARREMAQLADLVGAVRLPSNAHRRAAGTQAVTDLLVLRRREPDRPPAGPDWQLAAPFQVGDERVPMNEYFHHHPTRVLGELGIGRGMWGPTELLVTGSAAPAADFAKALTDLVSWAQGADLAMGVRAGPAAARPVALVGEGAKRPEGYIEALDSGGLTVVDRGVVVPYRPAGTQAAELRLLLGLRDTAVGLLEAEARTIDDTAEIDALRLQLNQRYDAYAARFGAINRFTWRRTGRRNDAGEDVMARIRPEQGGFKSDPFAMVVFALEVFDPLDQRATKADMFRERVVAPRAPRLGADTPEEALAICLDTQGRIDLDEITRLLGAPDETAARTALGRLVFDEPGTNRLVPAAEYLSGSVRQKLRTATLAAAAVPRFEVNVTALREVLPVDLGPEEITARLGASWIDARYVEEFLREVLEDESVTVEHPGGSTWTVRSNDRVSVLATSQWGTRRYPAPSVAQAQLEQRQIRIYDEYEDSDGRKRRVLNMSETVAAQAKAAELQQRFGDWVWEKPDRAVELARVYNDRFNSIVLRTYDDVELSLPGLALSFHPHPHQFAAVARIIAEPAVGLYHEVGAGKTAEMVMGAMELRRLGLVNKPAFVVPNHMLEQFSREFLQLYPRARLLAASHDDLERDRRRLFVARCATGNWDAVIMTESSFQRLPMSAERVKAYLESEVASIEVQIERSRGDRGLTVKRLEQAKLQAEERIQKLLDSMKDPGVTFEQTGIDYLFRDEGHRDKNLRTVSNIPGVAIDGSMRASDMHMKIGYLRERFPARWGTRATATPIANSVAEMYTEKRYLRPDLLEQAGIEDFDQWAATFGETVSAIEVAPDGSGFRLKARFARFANVPELLRIFHVFGDVKTAEDLQLPTPPLAPRPGDGQRAPEIVVVPRSDELAVFMDSLGARAERVRNHEVDPSEDNMLSISNDGRAAALDLRLVRRATEERTKIDVAAARIAAIWEAHRDAEYPSADGTPDPVRGSLQIVFSDLGTPKPAGEWSVYEELRDQLVARGLPRSSVRFIHDARSDREKGELFAACRNGQVAVLMGSTERMGIGTNVQRRAIALHHLDCPWRPADIRQREGRILRQGNLNPEVRILRYVTEASFDGFTWGVVERKATFIGQVMKGRLDAREVEDIGDSALTFQEVKALATGNPLLLDQAQAQADVARLERLERAHDRGQVDLRDSIRQNRRSIAEAGGLLAATREAITLRRDTRGDKFAITVRGQTLTKRTDAEALLRRTLTHLVADLGTPEMQRVELGSLGNFTIAATVRRSMRAHPDVLLELLGAPESGFRLEAPDIAEVAVVTRLENKLNGLDKLAEDTAQKIDRLGNEVTRAEGLLGKPFPQAELLREARSRVDAIAAQLEDMAEEQERRRHPEPPPAEPEPDVDAARREQRLEWARTSTAEPSNGAPTPAARSFGGRTP